MKHLLACFAFAASCAVAMPTAAPRVAKEPVGNRRIERIVQSESWGMGYGGSMVLRYRPIVLFTDNTFTYDADGAVNGKGEIAGRWRSDGGQVAFMSSDGKKLNQRSKPGPRPAKPQQMLKGRYGSFSGVGGGGTGTTSVVASGNYDFAADGTVRMGSVSGSSTPNNSNSKGSVVTRSTSAPSLARYSLDGYTITFTFGDGSTRKQLFYFMGSKEDVIVIGSRSLTRG